MKSGLVSVASVSAFGAAARGESKVRGSYVEGQKLTLGNKYLDWELIMTGETIQSVGLRNKLSGRYYELRDSKEFLLTLSRAKARVEIPWWYVAMGSDDDKASPDQERGYLSGYHLEDFGREQEWGAASNLLLRDARRVEGTPIFNGYAWFRQGFELPGDAEGEPIVFCLGGYTQEDWNKYWVFLNGKLVGTWTKAGRWRTPEELTIRPDSTEYAALRFGAGKKNLLSVRTYQYNKRFEGLRDEILDRFIFEGRLCDQFIAKTLLDRWERAFRAAAQTDDCASFRRHLRRLALPNKPKLVLEGTVSAVRMGSAYLSMDGRDKAVRQLLRMQTYNPAEATDARYVLTFDIFRKAFARILVDATLQPLDLADLYGSPWDDYKRVGFDSFWISHPDWSCLTKREVKNLEKQVTNDLRFDYTDDELEFWFDDSRDKSYLVVTLLRLC
jgi:hypothetical protein